MANLYTRTGDKGKTSLVGGSRVTKDNPRVDCYGTIDEATSMLGLAYSLTDNQYIRETVHAIQKKLFVLGAELASDEKGMEVLGDNILKNEDVAFLEKVVDTCTEITGPQRDFIIPGVNAASSALHVARTIVRRGERLIIAASGEEPFRDIVLQYVNRLSDAIYALARMEETSAQKGSL